MIKISRGAVRTKGGHQEGFLEEVLPDVSPVGSVRVNKVIPPEIHSRGLTKAGLFGLLHSDPEKATRLDLFSQVRLKQRPRGRRKIFGSG